MNASVGSFDTSALTEQVDRADIRAHARELRRLGSVASGLGPGLVPVVPRFALPILGLAVVAFFAIGILVKDIALATVLPLALLVGMIALWLRRRRVLPERWYRLDRFAQANRMTYRAQEKEFTLPGMIFDVGRDRLATDRVSGGLPRHVEFGNYHYIYGIGRAERQYTWGYVAVKLDVPLPHIVLDAKRNNLFGSNLPQLMVRDQELQLGGEFEQLFTLYCPTGYEADALYLFSPDIMVRFIDHVAVMDVEIVDDWLFCYTRREVSTTDPKTWAWLFSVVGALLDKLDQWSRWRDERLEAATIGAGGPRADHIADPAVGGASSASFATDRLLRPPPGVAEPGKRLRQRTPWVVIVLAVFWLLFELLKTIADFLD
ncbi:MAG: hypothetical protein ACK5H2_09570 [Beutenbergiaceae bacterium]